MSSRGGGAARRAALRVRGRDTPWPRRPRAGDAGSPGAGARGHPGPLVAPSAPCSRPTATSTSPASCTENVGPTGARAAGARRARARSARTSGARSTPCRGDARPAIVCAYGEPERCRWRGWAACSTSTPRDLALPMLVERVLGRRAGRHRRPDSVEGERCRPVIELDQLVVRAGGGARSWTVSPAPSPGAPSGCSAPTGREVDPHQHAARVPPAAASGAVRGFGADVRRRQAPAPAHRLQLPGERRLHPRT